MNVTRYKCSVLVVDDDPAVLSVLTGQLAADFEVLTACAVGQARGVLARRSVDMVMTDLQLPDESGLALLDWVRRTSPRTARILISGTARLPDAADAVNQTQVHRLILKPWRAEDLLQTLRAASRALLMERSHEQLLDELRRLNQELERRVADRTRELEAALVELQRKNDFLGRMALTDELTELPNLRAAREVAWKEFRSRRRRPTALTLMLVDADHFGQVNKAYSQSAGDQVLVWLAGVLRNSIRAEDWLSRVGGEEFEVLAPDADPPGAAALAERLRANVEAGETAFTDRSGERRPIRMTVSLGVAVAEAGTPAEYEALRLVAADALKEAKATGRNRAVIRVFTPPAG
jgi:diguanylate cyclase (GGDEF)-like protein